MWRQTALVTEASLQSHNVFEDSQSVISLSHSHAVGCSIWALSLLLTYIHYTKQGVSCAIFIHGIMYFSLINIQHSDPLLSSIPTVSFYLLLGPLAFSRFPLIFIFHTTFLLFLL